ncbi:4a-hydroxytetrahydrobiopterin dehydratase [Sphingomonas sp. GCM10030256]|uniref:4a-hydroxytetrahydrobiopterin dehydratase n=1 Tax=Sphingomonas sp. GCM10030256 TaxID=3273427 RepID=UPI003622C36E
METPAARAHQDGAYTREFVFADFAEAFGFLAEVALHAEKMDHHPEFTSVWNRVQFRLTSHDEGRPTERDRDLAMVIDRLALKALGRADRKN